MANELIFIAGSTGFIGSHLVRRLSGSERKVRCLVRNEDSAQVVRSLGHDAVIGDITDPASLKGSLANVETVIHLVGIIEERGGLTFEKVHVEGTENLINESKSSGVARMFYQSALGAGPDTGSRYFETKFNAETLISGSGIPYLIFRPSLILGEGDGFTKKMKQLVSAGPVVPIPGDGMAKLQPLYIDDWVDCFMRSLETNMFSNRIYDIGGPDHITFNEILSEIMKVLKIRKRTVHIPVSALKMTVPFMGIAGTIAKMIGKEIPSVTGELLSLLNKDNVCEKDSVFRFFGFEPIGLPEALNKYLA